MVLRRFEDNLVSSAELLNKRKLAIVESFWESKAVVLGDSPSSDFDERLLTILCKMTLASQF